jgi:hypothetical protein
VVARAAFFATNVMVLLRAVALFMDTLLGAATAVFFLIVILKVLARVAATKFGAKVFPCGKATTLRTE